MHSSLDAVLGALKQADSSSAPAVATTDRNNGKLRGMMLQARERELPLICANPDIVVNAATG